MKEEKEILLRADAHGAPHGLRVEHKIEIEITFGASAVGLGVFAITFFGFAVWELVAALARTAATL